jgi:hypothetical protein
LYNRPDVITLNEPWIIGENPDGDVINFDDFSKYETKFKNVLDKIASLEGNKDIIWIKEHAYVFGNFKTGSDIFQYFPPGSKIIFLLRDPLASFVSFRKIMEDTKNDVPPTEWRYDEIGLEGMVHLLETFQQHNKSFLLIKSEDLLSKTEETLSKICDYCNISFNKEAMQKWSPINENENTPFTGDFFKWFKGVCKSSCFHPNDITNDELLQYMKTNFDHNQFSDWKKTMKIYNEITTKFSIPPHHT